MANPMPMSDRLMDWLFERAGGSTTTSVSLQPFMDEYGWDIGAGLAAVRDGRDRGLLQDVSAMGDPCAVLTPAGIRQVLERRQRRADPAQRAVAARAGLLRWMYAQKCAGVNMPWPRDVRDSEYGWFEGERFTEDEIARAAEYLAQRGLINGPGGFGAIGPLRANIQPAGEDCVEQYGGDVSRYLDGQRNGGANISIGSITNSGALAVGNNVNQTVTSTVDSAAIATLVDVLLKQLPQLPLDAVQQGVARADLEEVRREVQRSDPDSERVRNGLSRFVERLSDPQVIAQVLALVAQGFSALS